MALQFELLLALISIDIFYTFNVNLFRTYHGIAAIRACNVFFAISTNSGDEVTAGLLIVATSSDDDVAIKCANLACGMGQLSAGIAVIGLLFTDGLIMQKTTSMASIFEFFNSREICGAGAIIL